jgi:RimJ/RimL family protein N-acetyltransferase
MMATLSWLRSRTWQRSDRRGARAADRRGFQPGGRIGGRRARKGWRNSDWRRTLRVQRMGSVSAELAFTTDSNYRGGGIATFILRHLVRIAREAGVSRFEADVLAENQPMLAVFRHGGLPMQLRRDGGVLHVTLSLQPDSRQQT